MTEQRTTPYSLTTQTAAATESAELTNVETNPPVIDNARNSGRRQSDRIVAASEASQRSLDQATAHARGDEVVMIVGPSGSGRKHFGRAIHAWSRRVGQPLVVFPVASSPEGLHETELFGQAVGSQILRQDSAGYLAAAGTGTLLIDGLDKLSPSVRISLVQALQSGSFRRPGQTDAVPIEARILATANSDVSSPVAGLQSTDKLLGDVPVKTVLLQGLADRREDVLPLAAHFLAEFSQQENIRPVGFTQDARNWLVEETWTGHVRELRERIRQAVHIGNAGVISAESLMLSTDGDDVPSFKDAKRAFETRYVEGLLRRCSGNISRAARLAKKDRKDFYDVIRRTGVVPGEFRT
jgi:two-component system, NtrC family, response regulator GlrR